jgi:hypothetical protein
MKLIWSPKDITPGRVVGKPGIIEQWIIGYAGYEKSQYHLVSLSDGMITDGCSKELLADRLTMSESWPVEFLGGVTT